MRTFTDERTITDEMIGVCAALLMDEIGPERRNLKSLAKKIIQTAFYELLRSKLAQDQECVELFNPAKD